MERRGAESLSMLCLLMMFVVGGQCGVLRAFQRCYAAKFSLCAIIPQNNAFYCGAKALRECTSTASSRSGASTIGGEEEAKTVKGVKHQFCNLGCGLSLCCNISTKLNPRVAEVAACFDSCSETTCKLSPSDLQTSGNSIAETKTEVEKLDHFCKIGCASSVCNIDVSTNLGKEEIGCDYCVVACA